MSVVSSIIIIMLDDMGVELFGILDNPTLKPITPSECMLKIREITEFELNYNKFNQISDTRRLVPRYLLPATESFNINGN